MRIRAKGRIKDKPADKFYDLEEGDEVTVPDEIGAYWVKNGWAVNVDTGEDNEPSREPVTLDTQSATVATNGQTN